MLELVKEENRESFCNFAFDKPVVSHYFYRYLTELLDHWFLNHSECSLVLEFMRIFARVVLQRDIYVKIYSSWKARVQNKLGQQV